jgi:hypothetical protein
MLAKFMEKTLLYEALLTLSTTERRHFAKFVQSPFFNQKAAAVALFVYLLHHLEQKTLPQAQEAFKAAFPNLAFDDAKLRLLNSHLLALLEHFWMYQAHFAVPEQTKIQLASEYRKRNLPKHFQIALREARAARVAQPWRDAHYFDDLYYMEWEQYQFDAASRRTDVLNLQETSDQMDRAFLIKKLRLACLALSHQAVYKTEYHIGLSAPVLALAATQLEFPAIGLYYHCHCFLSDTAPLTHFTQFTAMLLVHSAVLPADELRTLHLLAINFGIKRINQSQEDWLDLTFNLYKSALERDLLLENNLLSRFAFNNIVAIALRVGALQWASAFITQFKPRLERQFREATADLNLARVAYARKDFGAAIQHLQRADYKDMMNNLTAKTLQLKIYYETEAFDLLESHLASMKTFIRRHTAIGYHRTNYSKIVYYTQQLMQLLPRNTVEIAALRTKIQEEPVLTEKVWLLEQLDK